MRRKALILLAAFVVACAAFFTPLVPTSLFIRYGSLKTSVDELPRHISESDAKEILRVLREHGHYGLGDVPDYISLFAYFFEYRHIGIYPLEACGLDRFPACDQYLARVGIGMDCGSFCGGGMYFCFKEINGTWTHDVCGGWVD